MASVFTRPVPRYAEGTRVPSGPADSVGADSDLLAARTAVPRGHHSAEYLARHVAAHRELCQSTRRAAALSGRSREPPNSARDRCGHWLLHFTIRDQTAQQDPHARPLRRLPLHGTCILVLVNSTCTVFMENTNYSKVNIFLYIYGTFACLI